MVLCSITVMVVNVFIVQVLIETKIRPQSMRLFGHADISFSDDQGGQ